MRIVNPDPATVSGVTATDKTDLQTALAALGTKSAPTADEVRAVLTTQAKKDRFTDAFLTLVAQELGLTLLP